MMSIGHPEFIGGYRAAFVDTYEEEEYQFRNIHDIPFIPDYSVWEGEFHRTKFTGVFRQIGADASQGMRYCTLRAALVMMRTFLRECAYMTGYSLRGSAIAVASPEAAEYLRKGLGWRGAIINLQALDYPGMDDMHPTYLAHFRECGFGAHVPTSADWVYYPHCPTRIKRMDGSFGYIKCTARHVAVMRHWTELWYPVTVVQKKFCCPYQHMNVQQYQRFWDIYMNARINELCRKYPRHSRNFWY
jgi:hypothetical protein